MAKKKKINKYTAKNAIRDINKAEKLLDYTPKYGNMADKVLKQYLNRPDYKYDMNADVLYNQYKNQFVNQGRMAMQDAIGQASTLTGGYDNSYAQTVGQQTYNSYLGALNDKVPELYELGLNRYNQEGDKMLNLYSLYADKDAMLRDRAQQDYSNRINAIGAKWDIWNTKNRNKEADKQFDEQMSLQRAELAASKASAKSGASKLDANAISKWAKANGYVLKKQKKDNKKPTVDDASVEQLISEVATVSNYPNDEAKRQAVIAAITQSGYNFSQKQLNRIFEAAGL